MISGVKEQVEFGVKKIHALINPLENVRHGSESSFTNLESLLFATSEQSNSSQLIAQHIEQIARSTEMNLSLSTCTARAAERLKEMSTNLLGLVRSFSV